MENFDVIIVGGGPAGLKCADELARTDLNVLLLDKSSVLGDKLCAGGLTMKDMKVLPLPDSVIEHKISRAVLHSGKRKSVTKAPQPFLFTINRRELAQYQLSLLENTGVTVRLSSRVTEIREDRVILKNGREYGYRFLVGAEGYASVVRKYLGLPVQKKLIGFQYTLGRKGVEPELEVYLDSARFRSWYAWIFPHRDSIAVGCCCNPDRVDHRKFLENFEDWLEYRNIDTGGARLESYPISYDYRGMRFGNIFLAGEAAGLPSGLTGEGIYQSLVSGQEVARMILDPHYLSEPMNEVMQYNRMLHRVLMLFRWSGPLRGPLQELLVALMNRKRIQSRINASFT